MADSPEKGRVPIVMAGVLLVVAAGLFGAAFYFYDGVSVVSGLVSGFAEVDTFAPQPESANASEQLKLPNGMSEEFALGIWQEQVDSQRAIAPLVEGEVKALHVQEAVVDGDIATVRATTSFKDGTEAPGVIGLHRFGGVWYVTYVSSNVTTTEAEERKAELPEVSEVDVALLNTLIEEQAKGKAVTQDIVDGKIDSLEAGAVRSGPNTVTIPLKMRGGDAERSAELIAISSESGGKEFWLLARFNEAVPATK